MGIIKAGKNIILGRRSRCQACADYASDSSVLFVACEGTQGKRGHFRAVMGATRIYDCFL
jgi:hypothetical protein